MDMWTPRVIDSQLKALADIAFKRKLAAVRAAREAKAAERDKR